jgi:hypothetical protein
MNYITVTLPKFPKEMVLTGRVKEPLRILAEYNGKSIQAYYEGSTSFTIERERLTKVFPVSCTVLVVEDSLSERIYKKPDWKNSLKPTELCSFWETTELCSFWETINGSFDYLSRALSGGAGVALSLGNIRSNGSKNKDGLIASGPVALLPVYSRICEYVRQGGTYKKGAVTAYLDFGHDDILEFLNYPKENAPYIKKAVYVSEDLYSPNYIWREEDKEKLDLLINKYNSGEIFIVKESYCKHTGTRLYGNVCLEVQIKSRATCNLAPINLGLLKDSSDLTNIVTETIVVLNEIRKQIPRSEIYLKTEEDMQIGVGFIGLFNYLNQIDVRSQEITEKTDRVSFFKDLTNAMMVGDHVGKTLGLNRIWAIAPTVSCAMEAIDLQGYTTAMNISPPLCNPITKRMERVSEIKGVETITYPPEIESASEVDFKDYATICTLFQSLMDQNGRGHSVSFDVWDTVTVDRDFLKFWFKTGIMGLYYRQLVKGMSNTSKQSVEGMSQKKAQSLESFKAKLAAIDDLDIEDEFEDGEEYISCSSTRVIDTLSNEPESYCESCGG